MCQVVGEDMIAGMGYIGLTPGRLYRMGPSTGAGVNKAAQGSPIHISDSLHKPLRGLQLYGYSAQDGTPSPEEPVPIVSAGDNGVISLEITGKNLITGRMYYSLYGSGVPYIQNDIEVQLPYMPGGETNGICYVVPCREGITYSMSVANPNENAAIGIGEYKSLEDAINTSNATGSTTVKADVVKCKYTAKSNGVLICCLAGSWLDGKTRIHTCTESELIQVEVGDTITEYESPKMPQSLIFQTPGGLPGIPVDSGGNYTDANGQQWVADEIDLAAGVRRQWIGVHSNINDWNAQPGNTAIEDLRISLDLENLQNYHYAPCLCNYLPYKKTDSWGGAGTYITINEPAAKRIFIRIEGLKTIEEFREALPNIKVYYLLATPIENPLTPEELAAYRSLRTYSGTTIISNDAGCWMEAEYIGMK